MRCGQPDCKRIYRGRAVPMVAHAGKENGYDTDDTSGSKGEYKDARSTLSYTAVTEAPLQPSHRSRRAEEASLEA